MHDGLDLRDLVADELAQRRETGYEVAGLEGDVELALRDGAAPLGELLDRLARVPRLEGWPYEEPSGFGEILALLPEPSSTPLELDEATLRDRLPETTRGRIRSVARDDDIDYTILGLHLLETHGFGFGPREVGAEWLDHLPFTRTYTAERVAYGTWSRGFIPRRRPPTATRTGSGSARRSAPTSGAMSRPAALARRPRWRSGTPPCRIPPTVSTGRCGRPRSSPPASQPPTSPARWQPPWSTSRRARG